MAIVLGDTTITGLQSAGLPAGSVNLADFASGSVTMPKFGAGIDLNTQYTKYFASTTINTTSWTDVNSVTYTPLSSSSYIDVWMHINLWMGNSGTQNSGDAYIRLQVVGGGFASRTTFFENDRIAGNFLGTGSSYLHSHFNSWSRFTNSDTTQKTIYMQGALATGQSTALDYGHGFDQSFFIREIAR